MDLATHYDVLGAPMNASLQALKQHYRRRLLSLHPDHNTHRQANEQFCRLQVAWETLSDPLRRQAYDRTLPSSTTPTHLPIWRELHLSDLSEDADGMLSFECRCGSAYIVEPSELADQHHLLVPCDGCSLHLRILTR